MYKISSRTVEPKRVVYRWERFATIEEAIWHIKKEMEKSQYPTEMYIIQEVFERNDK